jgi:hypothetical protein
MRSAQRFKTLLVGLVVVVAGAIASVAQAPDQVFDLSHARRLSMRMVPPVRVSPNAATLSPVPGIDSIVNFTGDFRTPGVDSEGNPQNLWFYSMVGNPPRTGGTTVVNAPIIPVTVDLLDFDGSVRVINGHRLHYEPTKFVQPVLNSPVFQTAKFSSSNVPTQFTDAVQRAEFFNAMKPDWHTLLNPSVKPGRTMSIPRGTYLFALNEDGSCCQFVLVDVDTFVNLLFPALPDDTSTPIGAAENAGDITTKDLSSFLFPNTYLFFNGDPSQCCVLGFHSFDFEPGDDSNGFLPKLYVVDYASWITPGLFGASFADVTALSHEIAEIYDDPFVVGDGVHNATPWWLSPNGLCQNNLENGDVIEGLPDATFAMKMKGRTYHPQNEALLQWFEFQSPSTAIGGAYSYPNTKVLTSLSAPQNAGCAP